MAEISISIENKYFGGEHKVITLKQQFLGTLLYEMPSNLKGKNFVSKFPGYCPQNTMAFFSS